MSAASQTGSGPPLRSRQWIVPRIDEAAARELANAVGVGLPAARVLWNRGLRDAATVKRFLRPSIDDLNDPFALLGMQAAVARLRRAIASGEQILIYGDYDVDGTTSVVILKKAIELAGGKATFHIPNRLKDGYGMRPEIVVRAAADGVSLIVSVDTGIRAGEVVRRAAELGIDVIITDHHLPETEIPPALAVLNPNQPGCGYPDKNLCGVGVAFKLVQALLGGMGWPPEKLRRALESFLKLVAIGTVADVVPLTGENRIIVKHGLEGLHDVRNVGLRALMRIAGLEEGKSPSAGQIAFRLAPRINAAGRMASADDVIELFLTADAARAQQIAEQLHGLNAERQQTERQIIETILAECIAAPVGDDQAALVFAGEGWHRGVLGIVASRLVEKFHRPVFVLSHNPEDGTAQGSGRSIVIFHLMDALESMPHLFRKFGGHHHAAGLTLASLHVDEFRRTLNEYASARLTSQDFVPMIAADAEVTLTELTDAAAAGVLALQPFGAGNSSPLFVARDVEVAGEPCVMKDKHLRLTVRGGGKTLRMKAWNFAERACELTPGSRIDIAFELEEDSYSASRGFSPWSATLREYQPTATSPLRFP
ncbi:MAG: single-stranded-DNA-specific exonuclease RecJ [Bryobacteraceae bacterium]